MTDPIRAALERLHQYAETFPEHDTDSIVARARAALKADSPSTRLAVHPDGTPMVSIGEAADLDTIARLAADPEHARAVLGEPEPSAGALAASCRSLLEDVARMGDCIGKHTVGEITAISDRAAAWLQENPPGQIAHPAPPAEGEVGELVEWLRQTGDLIQPSHLAEHQRYKRAADLLSQRHSAPVPVAERSPEPEDCDGEGRCWWWNPPTYLAGTGWWEFEPYEWIEDATHWLPAHALPLPAGEVQP